MYTHLLACFVHETQEMYTSPLAHFVHETENVHISIGTLCTCFFLVLSYGEGPFQNGCWLVVGFSFLVKWLL